MFIHLFVINLFLRGDLNKKFNDEWMVKSQVFDRCQGVSTEPCSRTLRLTTDHYGNLDVSKNSNT